MKNFVLFSAAAAALIASPSFAQQPRGDVARGQGITRGEVETRVRDMFARVDANRDGFVTQSEAQAIREQARAKRQDRREARFAALDANGDGSISRDEFFAKRDRGDRGERRQMRGERRADRLERRGSRLGGGRLFERLDTNRDGRVSLAEATEARLAAFDRADSNRDGRVTREERRAVRADRQARRG